MTDHATLVELRVLDGPNLYFPRPAVKTTIAVPGWLRAPAGRVAVIAERLGAATTQQPGDPETEQRRRFVARIARAVTTATASAAGARIAVRARSGHERGEIVVAFPWRRRGSAEALGREVAWLMSVLFRRSPGRAIAEAARRITATDPGEEPTVPDPAIPVVQVTGTNGKTTTVRLLAHMVRSAGLLVAYSSTDGVYRGDGELVEAGDYSGFEGTARALAQEPDVAVCETARGGILLRGIGVLHNDVAVVTNVSDDHLDLHGIRTLDQLAEVKATITKITRAQGWDVLNADDPRVLAMRRGAGGRPWLFSLDPDHPAIRETLAEGGRATTIIDGDMTVLDGSSVRTLIPVLDVPVTIAGISSVFTQNALASASAGLAIGLPERAIVRGLKTFVLDPERNPGRANLFTLEGRIVVIDYAHNEAGMRSLIELCGGLRRKRREVWIAICAAGDRTDKILHDFAYRAARGADHVVIAELLRYLRGREREDNIERLRAGAADGGIAEVDLFADELSALEHLIGAAKRGDVVAITALAQRPEIFAWLEAKGADRLAPSRVRSLARSVQRDRLQSTQ